MWTPTTPIWFHLLVSKSFDTLKNLTQKILSFGHWLLVQWAVWKYTHPSVLPHSRARSFQTQVTVHRLKSRSIWWNDRVTSGGRMLVNQRSTHPDLYCQPCIITCQLGCGTEEWSHTNHATWTSSMRIKQDDRISTLKICNLQFVAKYRKDDSIAAE